MHSNAIFRFDPYRFGIMIDIRQMRYFVVLADTLHFGRAAERLHLTQPPLSRQIAALEKELGVKLLVRHSRHAELTAAGARFLEDSRAVLAAFDQACRNARLADSGELGELTVGFMMHAAYGVVPPLTRRFTADCPGVRLHLRELVPSLLLADVLAGKLDAGITFNQNPVRGLAMKVVHRERLCLAVPAGHRLAAAARVSAAQLAGEPLIAAPADVVPTLRKSIEDYFRQAGAEPTVLLQTQLQQTIVSLVAEGVGIALVPESLEKLGMGGVVFRGLEGAPVVEHVIAWRPGNLNPALGRFLEVAGVDHRHTRPTSSNGASTMDSARRRV